MSETIENQEKDILTKVKNILTEAGYVMKNELDVYFNDLYIGRILIEQPRPYIGRFDYGRDSWGINFRPYDFSRTKNYKINFKDNKPVFKNTFMSYIDEKRDLKVNETEKKNDVDIRINTVMEKLKEEGIESSKTGTGCFISFGTSSTIRIEYFSNTGLFLSKFNCSIFHTDMNTDFETMKNLMDKIQKVFKDLL
jgi:uncharacterized protein (UPF0297 family)